MSRIGRMPIEIPQGVEVRVEGNVVRVKGPKGELSQGFHPEMQVTVAEGRVVVSRPSDERFHRSLHGLTRTLIANMMEGVTKGYSRTLEIEGVGYRAAKSGEKLVLTVGYSHPVEIAPPPGIEFEVPSPTRIVVKGLDKQRVGEVAAMIRAVRKPEPYQGKGIRYENEKIRRKAGKTGKAAKK
ncbi:MAG: 50S ribosomal protein L6 [Firmicutes bacterium]|nr:50S ribosomal protein L6 [Bacillota bacterium]